MNKVIDSYSPLAPKGTEDRGIIKFVLTQDAFGMKAVYMGVGSDEFVKTHGDKLTFNKAKPFYPNLQKENYRNMGFRQYLRNKFGAGDVGDFRDYKRRFMKEAGHFKHDWIKLMNYQKQCYKNQSF